jgi:Inner membrane component of T3SS, cytoplasmic domain
MLRLLVTHGEEETVFALPDAEARLGRASWNDIVLRVPGVSRKHALLRRCSKGVQVVDDESKNGLFVEGEKVPSTILTPGLRLQIGEAWLQLEEAFSTEESLALLPERSSKPTAPLAPTLTVEPGSDPRGELSPKDASLALAFHIAQTGVGLPGERPDLLARIRAGLGAEAFLMIEKRRPGRLHILERAGEYPPQKELASLLEGSGKSSFPGQVSLKQSGYVLLAGRDTWFLVARFADETLARERWRKELLWFLAHRFLLPVRPLRDVNVSEARRVRALAGTRKRTAKLLGIARGTLNTLVPSSRSGED